MVFLRAAIFCLVAFWLFSIHACAQTKKECKFPKTSKLTWKKWMFCHGCQEKCFWEQFDGFQEDGWPNATRIVQYHVTREENPKAHDSLLREFTSCIITEVTKDPDTDPQDCVVVENLSLCWRAALIKECAPGNPRCKSPDVSKKTKSHREKCNKCTAHCLVSQMDWVDKDGRAKLSQITKDVAPGPENEAFRRVMAKQINGCIKKVASMGGNKDICELYDAIMNCYFRKREKDCLQQPF